MELTGTSAIVTGAASGLGAATAAALASRGVSVIGVDLPAGWEKAGDPPAGVRAVAGDVTTEDDVSAAVAAASQSGAPLRLAVSCAGVAWASRIVGRKGVHDLGLFSDVVRINLIGTFNVLRLAAEAMSASEPVDEAGQRGLVVNTAYVAAYDGQVGQIAYAASKGGIASMTLPAARDLSQRGVRVMAIAPGIMDTPMMASIDADFRAGLEATVPFPHRFGRPDEYASLVLSLVAQDYINGEVIRLDGSLRMPPR
jgi:NAD(P)-dependent dehydrogenase (short-subunit alcohol dehydrogenase family)